ncbi:type VI secretion system protein ImpG [Vibrio jasicida]|uniref:type VI secretion system baseplate subunit TssF n=1 Tax=Vibrio jasicida TaxID=766224 RepID=UPI000CF3F850|nr:type VI secretion system baseplate subunit TssF [Vibrio jasicida]PQJ69892.1 type VI secretion system protein ImpG [Vibrio jasicida]
MSEEFLKYYNRELAYLRHKGQEFGEQYPKIASRLRISEEQVEDPHVERLLEGCAFLTARIRQSLDNSYPQFTESLLGQLYPDFHAPIPSMSIVKMTCSESTNAYFDVVSGERVVIGAPRFKECEFRTCYETRMYPLRVNDCSFENAPVKPMGSRWEQVANSMLNVQLHANDSESAINLMGIDTLRFYLNGQPQLTQKLYQMLFQNLVGLSVSVQGKEVASYTKRHLKSVGFSDSDKVVPYGKRSFSASRMLVEYLHFPEKFMFFDLIDLELNKLDLGESISLCFFFDSTDDWLPKQVDNESLMLGCTPVINLFQSTMEPKRLLPSEYDYQLSPQYQEAESNEVVSITNVTLRNWNKTYENLPCYYAGEHTHYMGNSDIYWLMRREDKNWAGGYDEPGRETYLSFVDKKHQLFSPESRENWLMYVQAECCNRNLPQKLPFGGGLPEVSLPDVNDNFESVRCLVSLSETVRPEMDESTRWQLTKLLTLNHFTQDDGLVVLKQTLNLYAFSGTAETKALIDALVKLEFEKVAGRVSEQGKMGFAHGVKLILTVSDQILLKEQIFFLGCVLSVYLSQYAEVNIFTQLEVKLKSTGKRFYQWPSLTGDKVLL